MPGLISLDHIAADKITTTPPNLRETEIVVPLLELMYSNELNKFNDVLQLLAAAWSLTDIQAGIRGGYPNTVSVPEDFVLPGSIVTPLRVPVQNASGAFWKQVEIRYQLDAGVSFRIAAKRLTPGTATSLVDRELGYFTDTGPTLPVDTIRTAVFGLQKESFQPFNNSDYIVIEATLPYVPPPAVSPGLRILKLSYTLAIETEIGL